jgi:hypothetical protein
MVWLVVMALLAASTTQAEELVDARQMRKAGAGVMGVGLVHLALGLGLTVGEYASYDVQCANRPFPCGEGVGLALIPSYTILALGVVLTGVGMPLYFVGRARERRLQRTRTLTLVPRPPPVAR